MTNPTRRTTVDLARFDSPEDRTHLRMRRKMYSCEPTARVRTISRSVAKRIPCIMVNSDYTTELQSMGGAPAMGQGLPGCIKMPTVEPASENRLTAGSPFYEGIFGLNRAKAAPVGSSIMLNQPMPGISVTSARTVAPRDIAFLVEAPTSSTRT
jgi:hypothetical protein